MSFRIVTIKELTLKTYGKENEAGFQIVHQKRKQNQKKTVLEKLRSKMTELSPSFSVITLNVNGLNSSIKVRD
jgi:hypothetical protein